MSHERRIQRGPDLPGVLRPTRASEEALSCLPEVWQEQYEEWLERRRVVQDAFPRYASPAEPDPPDTEPAAPTLAESRQVELGQMAAEGVVLGDVAGLPVKLRPRAVNGTRRRATGLPSWDARTIYIEGDPLAMVVTEVAGWLLAGPMVGRTPRQAMQAAKRLQRVALKAFESAGRRAVEKKMEP